MKRTASRAALRAAALCARFGVVALIAACRDGSDGPRVDFAITHTDQVKGAGSTPLDLPPEPAIVQGGAGAVEAHGLVAAPDECDDLAAQVEAEDSLLTLRVVVRGSRSHPGACGGPGEFALFQWRARIAPVEPGQHQVRILYDYRGLRRHPTGEATAGGRDPFSDRVVAEQTVTVQ
jgi:hypothetical protein